MISKNLVFRFTLGVLVSILVTEIVLRLTAPILGQPLQYWNTMQDAKIYKLSKRASDNVPNLFIFGNSTALIGVNPNILSPKGSAFNLAMNGSDSLSMTRFAGEIIAPNFPGTTMIFFYSIGSARNAQDDANHPYNVATPRADKQFALTKIVRNYSFVYRYRNYFRDPLWINTIRSFVFERKVGNGIVERWAEDLDTMGYSIFPIPTNSISGGWSNESISNSTEIPTNIRENLLEDFRKLERISNLYGIRVIISTVPTTLRDDAYREIYKELSSYFNFEFLQGNDAVKSGDFFQDGVHLNQIGAKTFSKFIVGELKRIGCCG